MKLTPEEIHRRFREMPGLDWSVPEALVLPLPTPPPLPPEVPPPNPWEETVMGMSGGVPVTISAKDRCEHTLLLGKTGQGKSVLMRSWMRQDIESGRGFVCMDPHGSLINGVLKDIPLSRQNDVVYLDAADDEWPFGLNLFATPKNLTPKAQSAMTDQLVQVFKKTWEGQWATTTGDWLKVIATTFMDNRRGTMANIPKLLTDAQYRASYMPRLTDIFARQAWEAATNTRTGELAMTEIRPTLLRMRKFLMNPVLTNIVGQSTTTLDFTTWMAEHKIVLIRLPGEGDEGIGDEAVALLGTVMLQLILRAAFSREVGSVLYPVYCDEFDTYVTPDMPKIIKNVRKYGVGLFLATQSFAHISDEAIRDTLLGVGSLLCYQVTEKDARIVAGEFRSGVDLDEDWEYNKDGYLEYQRPTKTETASRLANLQALRGKGTCLAKTNWGEFELQIPNVEEHRVPGPIAKRGIIIRNSRARYCRARDEVEREIRQELMPEEGVFSPPVTLAPVFLDQPPPRR